MGTAVLRLSTVYVMETPVFQDFQEAYQYLVEREAWSKIADSCCWAIFIGGGGGGGGDGVVDGVIVVAGGVVVAKVNQVDKRIRYSGCSSVGLISESMIRSRRRR